MFKNSTYPGNNALVANKYRHLFQSPTSHLALRGKLKGQGSCQPPDGKREGSKNAEESSTFYLLRPRPKIIKSHVSCSTPPDFPTQSHESAARKSNQSTRDCNLLPLKSSTIELLILLLSVFCTQRTCAFRKGPRGRLPRDQ